MGCPTLCLPHSPADKRYFAGLQLGSRARHGGSAAEISARASRVERRGCWAVSRPSTGRWANKILRGERKLTVSHVKKRAAAFRLSPSCFIA